MRGQTWTEDAIRADMVTQFDPATGVLSGIEKIRAAFVKRDEIAWLGTHRHAPDGNQIYIPSYFFVYAIDLPRGVSEPAASKRRTHQNPCYESDSGAKALTAGRRAVRARSALAFG